MWMIRYFYRGKILLIYLSYDGLLGYLPSCFGYFIYSFVFSLYLFNLQIEQRVVPNLIGGEVSVVLEV